MKHRDNSMQKAQTIQMGQQEFIINQSCVDRQKCHHLDNITGPKSNFIDISMFLSLTRSNKLILADKGQEFTLQDNGNYLAGKILLPYYKI